MSNPSNPRRPSKDNRRPYFTDSEMMEFLRMDVGEIIASFNPHWANADTDPVAREAIETRSHFAIDNYFKPFCSRFYPDSDGTSFREYMAAVSAALLVIVNSMTRCTDPNCGCSKH